MKVARIDDVWRRLYTKQSLTKINKVIYKNILGLGSGEIEFHGKLTAICGLMELEKVPY